MLVSTISFYSDTEDFLFSPIKAYKLIARNHLIVSYRLEYINNKTGKKLRSIINYYVSNGHTNMFRANILFPFLCYSKKNEVQPTCPTFIEPNQFGSNGGLIKLQLVSNINRRYIKSILQEKYVGFVTQERQSGKIIQDKFQEIDEKKETLGGVITSRLTNYLDLLIALGSSSICNDAEFIKLLGGNLECLLPVFTENSEYNLDVCDKSKISPEYQSEESILYRKAILVTFRQLYDHVKEFVTFELHPIDIEDISIDDFNNIGSVCKKPNTTLHNLQDYITISNQLYESTEYVIEAPLLMKNGQVKYLDRNKIPQVIFDDPTEYINNSFKTTCRNASDIVTEVDRNDSLAGKKKGKKDKKNSKKKVKNSKRK